MRRADRRATGRASHDRGGARPGDMERTAGTDALRTAVRAEAGR